MGCTSKFNFSSTCILFETLKCRSLTSVNAKAELTASMPKAEAGALVSSIKKAGLQANRGVLASLVPDAEGVFSKNAEAIAMVAAGKDVEPNVISTALAAIK